MIRSAVRAGHSGMFDHIKLEVLDRDGALRETAEAAGIDRADFLKKGALAGAGALGGGLLLGGFPSAADAAISRRKSKRNDAKIANYALTLEYLEDEFYRQANANKPFSSDAYRLFAEVTGEHEGEHVRALRGLLGRAAVKKPTFDFGSAVTDAATFAATAQALEDAGVAAYAGQGPNIAQRNVVVAALSIHSVEARHAAWIRFLNSGGAGDVAKLPAPEGFDAAASERKTLRVVEQTGFIKG
jgi:hypothetical protein